MGKTGLIVEGGGMKCAYSAGILDKFLDDSIAFDYCIGVSAGAANTLSYRTAEQLFILPDSVEEKVNHRTADHCKYRICLLQQSHSNRNHIRDIQPEADRRQQYAHSLSGSKTKIDKIDQHKQKNRKQGPRNL